MKKVKHKGKLFCWLILLLVIQFNLIKNIHNADSIIPENSEPFSSDILSISRFLGGNDSDICKYMEIDIQGDIIIGGETTSADFPADNNHSGMKDIFLIKMKASGTLLWTFLLGGEKHDGIGGITIDNESNILVVGTTQSVDFPFLNSSQSYLEHSQAFLVKLSPDGTLIEAIFFGGSKHYVGSDIELDNEGNIIIGGYAHYLNRYIATYVTKTFITKYSTNGTRLWWSSYGDASYCSKIALGLQGEIYVGGIIYAERSGGNEYNHNISPYIQRVAANGTLEWNYTLPEMSEYLYMGWELDSNWYNFGDLNVDLDGNVILSGPVMYQVPTEGAYDSTYNGNFDIYLLKLSPTGTFQWSTYLGGTNDESNQGFIITPDNSILLIGKTDSSDFPLVNGFQKTPFGVGSNCYLTKFDRDGALTWSAYFGGSNADRGVSLIQDDQQNILIGGETRSNDFPVTLEEYEYIGGEHGAGDAFIAIIQADWREIISSSTTLIPTTTSQITSQTPQTITPTETSTIKIRGFNPEIPIRIWLFLLVVALFGLVRRKR